MSGEHELPPYMLANTEAEFVRVRDAACRRLRADAERLAARPAAGDTRGDRERLREAIISRILDRWRALRGDETYLQASEHFAGVVMDEVAALLDAAEILTAVRELHHRDDTEPYACDYCGQAWPCDVIHALDTALADQP